MDPKKYQNAKKFLVLLRFTKGPKYALTVSTAAEMFVAFNAIKKSLNEREQIAMTRTMSRMTAHCITLAGFTDVEVLADVDKLVDAVLEDFAAERAAAENRAGA